MTGTTAADRNFLAFRDFWSAYFLCDPISVLPDPGNRPESALKLLIEIPDRGDSSLDNVRLTALAVQQEHVPNRGKKRHQIAITAGGLDGKKRRSRLVHQRTEQ
jgi:hypothetical protein